MNTHVRDNFNETAPAVATTTSRLLVTDGANQVAERAPDSDFETASESTTSTSYTDLTTAGPTVTVTTGTRAIVIVSAEMNNSSAGNTCFMSYAVSGSSTISAFDSNAVMFESDPASQIIVASRVSLESGLTAGSNTFTSKYRVAGGTGIFDNREIIVIPF